MALGVFDFCIPFIYKDLTFSGVEDELEITRDAFLATAFALLPQDTQKELIGKMEKVISLMSNAGDKGNGAEKIIMDDRLPSSRAGYLIVI